MNSADSAVVAEISEVILRYINPNSDGTSTSSFSQLTALVWLHELLLLLLPDASPHQKSRASDECPTDSGAGGSISERRDASRKLKWREDAQKHLKVTGTVLVLLLDLHVYNAVHFMCCRDTCVLCVSEFSQMLGE